MEFYSHITRQAQYDHPCAPIYYAGNPNGPKRLPPTHSPAVNHNPGYMPLYQSIASNSMEGGGGGSSMSIGGAMVPADYHHRMIMMSHASAGGDQRLMVDHHQGQMQAEFRTHNVVLPGSPHHLQGTLVCHLITN